MSAVPPIEDLIPKRSMVNLVNSLFMTLVVFAMGLGNVIKSR